LNFAFANLTAAGFAIFETLSEIGYRFSEDCLTLNVWVPSGGEASKAVMLWIYGGGFSSGTTVTSTYNGQNLASQEDVIVVSIKYISIRMQVINANILPVTVSTYLASQEIHHCLI
jgi:cholinesterase